MSQETDDYNLRCGMVEEDVSSISGHLINHTGVGEYTYGFDRSFGDTAYIGQVSVDIDQGIHYTSNGQIAHREYNPIDMEHTSRVVSEIVAFANNHINIQDVMEYLRDKTSIGDICSYTLSFHDQFVDSQTLGVEIRVVPYHSFTLNMRMGI